MNTQLSDRCRTSLYRVIFGKPDSGDERVVFLMAGSRDAASRRAMAVLVVLYDIDPLDQGDRGDQTRAFVKTRAVGALSETVRSTPEVGRLTFYDINDAALQFPDGHSSNNPRDTREAPSVQAASRYS